MLTASVISYPGWGNCKRLQHIGKAVNFRKNQKELLCQALRYALGAFFAAVTLRLCMIFVTSLVRIDSAAKIIINNQRISANWPRGVIVTPLKQFALFSLIITVCFLQSLQPVVCRE